ncbi:MAG: pantoate--beta-alanine ligase [Armatimonadetes bacterium]|nr:pantoate--beta-alanine ligase [Armatimonadota bacterium]
MTILRFAADLRSLPQPVMFVPTMGGLHEGHLNLIHAAKRHGGTVVASIFVNPTQFGDRADFDAYQRDLGRDGELAEGAGCDVIFAPSVEQMYPGGTEATRVHVPEVTDKWEGEHRPSHFDGVATVVSALFNMVRPAKAFFGQKDWQQCVVVAKMVRDLGYPIELRFEETVREPHGLAMSSRNERLSADARRRAAVLYTAIRKTADEFRLGGEPRAAEANTSTILLQGGFESVDYVAIVDEDTLAQADLPTGQHRVIAAAQIEGVRLIDNIRV